MKAFSEESTSPQAQSVSLSDAMPSWVSVLGGNAVAEPVRSSYGYVIPCEGRMVCAITATGTILWQKSFGLKLQPFVSVGISDMVYAVTKDSLLNMLNPSGTLLWTRDTGFAITEAPLPGRDGRVFVKGKKSLSCYGINGVRRWLLQTEDLDTKLPLSLLNDGSLLVFLEKRSGGKSIAKRVTPFGEVSEEIVFAGRVERVKSCKDGVLLSFADGSAGLCAVKENRAYSAWAVPQSQTGFKSAPFIALDGFGEGRAAFVGNASASVIGVLTKNGSLFSEMKIPLNGTAIKFFQPTVQGLVLSDQNSALCILPDGTVNWQCSFDKKKKWRYLFATDSGYLAFCTSSWSVEAFRVKQNPGALAEKTSFVPLEVGNYREIYGESAQISSLLLGRAISDDYAHEMEEAFLNGDFGTREGEWLSVLDNEVSLLYSGSVQGSWDYTAEKNFFQTNVAYKETVLNLAAKNGTLTYEKNIASLLKKTSDSSLLLVLVKDAGSIALDPNGDLLDSLAFVLRKKLDSKNSTLAEAICDSVYEICRVMGRPSFAKGQQLLSYLLYPQYPAHIQAYARETLKKLGEDTASSTNRR